MASVRTSLIIALVFLAIGSRLDLAAAFHGNYDQDSFEIVVGIMRRGGNTYAETSRYNYSPLWAHILLGISYFSDWTLLPFHFAVRGFGTLVDVVDAAFVGLVAHKVQGWKRSTGFVLYLINPVTVLLTGYHGQFENLAVLPLLVCLWLCLSPSRSRHGTLVWMLGTLALVIKHIVVFGVWTLFVYAFGWKRAVVASLAAVAILLLTFIPYLPAGRGGIVQDVLLYASSPYFFGLGLFLPGWSGMGIFLVAMAAWPLLARRYLPIERAMQASFVGLIGLIPGFGVQYLLMPVPFATSLASVEFVGYSLSAGALLLFSPANVNLGGLPQTVWQSFAVLTTILTWAWLVACVRDRLTGVKVPGLA